MLARFLHSGKFWLELIILGSFSMLLLVLGLYTALYQMFDAAKIQTLLTRASKAAAAARALMRKSAAAGFRAPPSPCATLPSASRTAAPPPCISTKRKSAWPGAIFSAATFNQKWVVNRADVELFRDAEGRWSLQDLWAARGRPLQVNRLIINDSRLNLYLPTHSSASANSRSTAANLQAPDKPFTFGGSAESGRRGSIAWQSSGTLNLRKPHLGCARPAYRSRSRALGKPAPSSRPMPI